MKHVFLFVSVVVFVGSLTVLADQYAESTHIKTGDAVPPFLGKTLSGEVFAPEQLEGKIIYASVGYSDREFEKLVAAVEQALGSES